MFWRSSYLRQVSKFKRAAKSVNCPVCRTAYAWVHCTLSPHPSSPKNVDAGGQCWSSRVWPDFVLYPDFVHNVPSLCLDYVLVQCLTTICLQYQTFVLTKSNICPSDPTFVLFLSCDLAQINQKIGGQKVVKNWTWIFPVCHLVTLRLDKCWTNSGLADIQHLSYKHFH